MSSNELISKINESHNPNLINCNASPNDNIIYHIYFNGEITHQKGGWAYLQRSEFTLEHSIYPSNNNLKQYFPKDGYAITTLENAKIIRNMIKEIKK